MKKFLALFVALATMSASMAAIVFNADSFTRDDASIPVFMKGTLNGFQWYNDECSLVKDKVVADVFMTFCQPCINCITCDSDGYPAEVTLTNVTLFVVYKNKADKVAVLSVVYFDELDFDLMRKDSAKKGDVFLNIPALDPSEVGFIVPSTQLFGDWNQKTWFTGYGVADGGSIDLGKVPAIMGIIRTLSGNYKHLHPTYASGTGTLTLRRDDSQTKALMLDMTTTGSSKTYFLDCEDPATFQECEDVIYSDAVSERIYKSIPKSWKVEMGFITGDIEDEEP